MKKISLLLIIFSVLLLGAGCLKMKYTTTKNSETNIKKQSVIETVKYENKKLGYKIEYPAYWSIVKFPDSDVLTTNNKYHPLENITISVEDLPIIKQSDWIDYPDKILFMNYTNKIYEDLKKKYVFAKIPHEIGSDIVSGGITLHYWTDHFPNSEYGFYQISYVDDTKNKKIYTFILKYKNNKKQWIKNGISKYAKNYDEDQILIFDTQLYSDFEYMDKTFLPL